MLEREQPKLATTVSILDLWAYHTHGMLAPALNQEIGPSPFVIWVSQAGASDHHRSASVHRVARAQLIQNGDADADADEDEEPRSQLRCATVQ
jgi:hypothetical protein